MASVASIFVQKLSSLWSKKSASEENEEESEQLSQLENIILKVQKILIWEDPFLSCCCIVSVNIVFWLIIYLDFKFYGLIFTAMLIITFQQLWVEQISRFFNKNESVAQSRASNSLKASDTRKLTASKINGFIKIGQIILREIYVKTCLLRQAEPGTFCMLICLDFLLLTVIGRSMPGVMTLYILLMLSMTVPGVLFHFLPPSVISSLSNFVYSSRKESDNDNDNDEVEAYLPETNPEALELLRLAGDLQLPNQDDEESNDLLLERISGRTSDTAESISSKLSFLPESSIMPSPENSMDFLEFDLTSGGHAGSENNDINFQSKHFDGDSSDEEEFAKGLNLTEKNTEKTKKDNGQQGDLNASPSMLTPENLISMGTNLLKTALQQNTARSDRESSSDTDSFEMISEEDM